MPRFLNRIFTPFLLAAALIAQEPGTPTFDSTAKLVLVPFHVERGKYYAADLQPSDFILHEDGHPREFTIFEGPNTSHPLPLELILLFDTTPKVAHQDGPAVFDMKLDPKADYEFLGGWDESAIREVLHKNGMDILLAVYHYAGGQLERLCAPSSDSREITGAFQRLLDPIPPGKGELGLLPGDYVPKYLGVPSKNGWMAESIVAALKDAAESPAPARRLLMVFTVGSRGTMSKSASDSSIVDPALAASVPLYPVILAMERQERHLSGTGPGVTGLEIAEKPASPDAASSKAGLDSTWYKGFIPSIAKVGELTGGEAFIPRHLNREALANILGLVRDTALSQYVVGFSPDTAAKPKKHSLTVKLSSKSKGKLVGGEKDGVRY